MANVSWRCENLFAVISASFLSGRKDFQQWNQTVFTIFRQWTHLPAWVLSICNHVNPIFLPEFTSSNCVPPSLPAYLASLALSFNSGQNSSEIDLEGSLKNVSCKTFCLFRGPLMNSPDCVLIQRETVHNIQSLSNYFNVSCRQRELSCQVGLIALGAAVAQSGFCRRNTSAFFFIASDKTQNVKRFQNDLKLVSLFSFRYIFHWGYFWSETNWWCLFYVGPFFSTIMFSVVERKNRITCMFLYFPTNAVIWKK